MKTILLIIPVFILASCVSGSEHEQTLSELSRANMQRDSLKAEIEEIKFGAPNLLADGIKFYTAKDFQQARSKFNALIQRHPDMPQAIEANKYLKELDEEELWNNALTSEDITNVNGYLMNYPAGKYLKQAVLRHKDLKAANKAKAYADAESVNTSTAWKDFLSNYPDFADRDAIDKKIIRLEVEEISGEKETGKMPSMNQYGSSYSSRSSVRITNNTGCDLTVRYSGPDADVISIAAGDTKTMNLSSGNYMVAASACGHNYAGSENLGGNYESTFYITSSRY